MAVGVSGTTVNSPWIDLNASGEIKTGRYDPPASTGGAETNVYAGLASANAGATFSAPNERNIIITSNLENSYYKIDDGSLPDAEYRDGKPMFGPYAVRDRREDNGSLKVDTRGYFKSLVD